MTQAPQLVVSDNPGAGRFEAHLGDQLAGVAEYQLAHDLIVFTHTEVEPAFEGRGVGSALAAHALSEVRAAGERRVLPLCPFIREWIQRHPEYLDLVAPEPSQR
jgi:predicted GNAT family acetyltransferase